MSYSEENVSYAAESERVGAAAGESARRRIVTQFGVTLRDTTAEDTAQTAEYLAERIKHEAERIGISAGDLLAAILGEWPAQTDDVDDAACEGHPADESHPLGETVYCDGSCRTQSTS